MLHVLKSPVRAWNWICATKKRRAGFMTIAGFITAGIAVAWFTGTIAGGGGSTPLTTGQAPKIIEKLAATDMPSLLEPAGTSESTSFNGSVTGSALFKGDNTGDGGINSPVHWSDAADNPANGPTSPQQPSGGAFTILFPSTGKATETVTSIQFDGVTESADTCGGPPADTSPNGLGWSGTILDPGTPHEVDTPTGTRSGFELPAGLQDSVFVEWPDGKVTLPGQSWNVTGVGTVAGAGINVPVGSTNYDPWGLWQPGGTGHATTGPGNGQMTNSSTAAGTSMAAFTPYGDGYPIIGLVDDNNSGTFGGQTSQTCLSGLDGVGNDGYLTAWFTATGG